MLKWTVLKREKALSDTFQKGSMQIQEMFWLISMKNEISLAISKNLLYIQKHLLFKGLPNQFEFG
jgi:hypothetical protein